MSDKNSLVLASLKNLPEQIIDGFKQTAGFKLPKNYRACKNIVVAGMGGSNLGAHIIKNVFAANLPIPLLVNADYELGGFVNKDTLFIASSYSGATEETLHAYDQAKKLKAKIVVLTAADPKNKLAALAKKDGYPLLAFSSSANPAGQPRLGLGYAVSLLLAILQTANLIKIGQKTMLSAVQKMAGQGQKLSPEKSNNLASQLADELKNKNIFIITGPFLAGNARALRNQFNESSKNLAAFLTLPDLNHHALEGLAFPKSNAQNIACLFFESALYSPRVQKRLELTKKIVIKNRLKVVSAKLAGRSKLEQALEMLALGAWLTYYLGLLNQVDIASVPWVDWFKRELK